MENVPKVTVMITFYNQKDYIKECLTSVLEQKTNFEFEILCGDDGSTDGTYEDLLQWQSDNKNLLFVYQMPRDNEVCYEPIARVSNNRINLLKRARGKYITFLDGDDYYCDVMKLQRQVDILENNPNCIGCGHPIKMIWENETSRDPKIVGAITKNPVIIKKEIYWKYLWLHADTLLFRNIWTNGVDNIEQDFFDDNIITCYHLKYGDIIFLPNIMAVYRQIGESSWNKRTDLQKAYVNMKVYKVAVEVLENMRYESFIKCYNAWKEIYNNRNTNIVIDAGMSCIRDIKFVAETIDYTNKNFAQKLKYEIKYGLLLHLGLYIKITRKLRFLTYKKVNISR